MDGEAQIVFVDTPGIFAPKRRLDRAMVDDRLGRRAGRRHRGAADRRAERASTTEADGAPRPARARSRQPKILVLNKIDLVKRETLLALADEANEAVPFERTFMISALTGDGVDDFMAYLAERVPPGPWLYPEDQVADMPLRLLAAEITREKLFERLHQELPYAGDGRDRAVEGAARTARSGSSRPSIVERDSQKKIVLGKGGQTIKAISMAARKEIAEIAERPVHLFLFVKVRENWADDPERYREMGLEFPRCRMAPWTGPTKASSSARAGTARRA